MLTLNYGIEINADAKTVWKILTESDNYQRWAKAFSPQSQFEGNWNEGEDMLFFDPSLGGTRACIDKIVKNQSIEYHHVGIFFPEHLQDIDSDVADKWIGSSEEFYISELESSVVLQVTVKTHPDFVSMFNNGWEKALPMFKELCEE
ncbi:SRPBCC domain-containing protein [Vibrio sp. ZSDE26]|uniref:SRPBCC domain-containing protein n=1 Tax=Vibrio amylolyticus TaxID=2847292 RepID=A0A9X1XMJ8_9VIBR|nr:SRPBCC domain-containing protein [Vibrio amylolyticus]MCK6263695.1 SRPBCC domain-containing protein [Vibrio amylolyticus]